MKRINFKGISEILSSKELKNVTGGSLMPNRWGCASIFNTCQDWNRPCCIA